MNRMHRTRTISVVKASKYESLIRTVIVVSAKLVLVIIVFS